MRGVSVRFSTGRKAAVEALAHVDLEAESGEIVGILGPNGAGKTTALHVLAGLQRPTQGAVEVLGHHPADRSLVRRVGFQPEGPLPFRKLTGTEFLHYLGNLMHLGRGLRDGVAAMLAMMELEGAAGRRIETYSAGMARRLALAAALMSSPDVLLLDEPTSALDPEGSELVMSLLRERAAAGCTILMASHHLQEVEQLCDRVYIFSKGTIACHGTLDELLGTGATRLVIRDLDAAGLESVRASIHAAGGQVVAETEERDHLNSLYRRMARLS